MKANQNKNNNNEDYIDYEEEEDINDQDENNNKNMNEQNQKRSSPKYHRNNALIHKSNIRKKKIYRSQREENPLKSVAQKIKNSTLKNEKIDSDKDNNEENEQSENEENEEDEQGIIDIQDLEQDENDDIDEENIKKNEKEKTYENKNKDITIKQQYQFKPVEKQINNNNKNIVNVSQGNKYISPREKYRLAREAK